MSIIAFDGTPNASFLQRVCANQLRTYLDAKEMLDHLIQVRGDIANPQWAAVEADLGAPVGQGQAIFNAVDTFHGNALNAYNAVLAFYGKLQA